MSLVMNARMYAVTPEAEAAWRTLLEAVTAEAGVAMAYLTYPAPQPLEELWRRPDLGCVFMCGYPVALRLAPVTPLAAPVPAATWAGGRAVYRSDLIVRRDAAFRTLEDTFGLRAGWTVEHSHSGFNAFRHHLLRHVTPQRPRLYGTMTGGLVTARAILDAVAAGTIDVGPLDAYWHMLIARHRPELTEAIRVIDVTATAPMPAFVAGPAVPAEIVARLQAAFASAHTRRWFARSATPLLLERFQPVTTADYAPMLAWDREAKAAGYGLPA